MCRAQKKLDSHQIQKYSPGPEQIRHVGRVAIAAPSICVQMQLIVLLQVFISNLVRLLFSRIEVVRL